MNGKSKVSTIDDASSDGYALLEHLCLRGVPLDFSKIRPLLKATSTPQTTLDDVDETEFWEAIRYLAATASPTTVDSLRIVRVLSEESGRSALARFANTFRDLRTFILVMSLVSLSVFSVLLYQLNYITGVEGHLRTATELLVEKANVTMGRYELTRLSSFAGGQVPEATIIETTQQNINNEYSQTLCTLYDMSDRFEGMIASDPKSDEGDRRARLCRTIVTTPEHVARIKAGFADDIRFNRSYLIPVLLSILGSTVYILRHTSRQVHSYTIEYVSFPLTILRLSVGAIAGVAIGWVYADQEGGVGLAPIALSFLAGYSVEILFSLLDRLTATFSDTAGPEQKYESGKRSPPL